MKNKITRINLLVLSLLLLISSICVMPASAAEKWLATSNIKTYVLSTKNNTTVYQTATSTKKYGTIYASDLITIKGYDKSKKRIKVTYPVSNGSKTGWIPLSAVTKSAWNSAQKDYKVGKKATTYRRSDGKTEFGYISKGDKISVIATSGSYSQVIYPISGGYKMGWAKTKDLIEETKEPDKPTAKSLADTAAKEVGYQGTGKNGKGKGDYTKYGKWIGANGQAWCASFVSWCVNQSGVSTKKVPQKASCNTMKQESNSYHKWSGSALKNIKKNDVIFFSEGNQDSHHVGVVYSVSGSKITVIEGNTSNDKVEKRTYTVDSKSGRITKGWSGHYFCGYISVN